jgi:chromosome segregation ATPase
MKQRTLILALSLLISLSAICTAFYAGSRRVNTKLIRQTVEKEKKGIVEDYEKKLAERDAIIKAKTNEISRYRKKYAELLKKLSANEKERESIKPPSTLEELKERFRALGYDVR